MFVVNPRWRKLHPLSSGFRRSHQKRRFIWRGGGARFIAAVLKTVGRDERPVGSNPTPSASVPNLLCSRLCGSWSCLTCYLCEKQACCRLCSSDVGFIWSSTQVAIRGSPAKGVAGKPGESSNLSCSAIAMSNGLHCV